MVAHMKNSDPLRNWNKDIDLDICLFKELCDNCFNFSG